MIWMNSCHRNLIAAAAELLEPHRRGRLRACGSTTPRIPGTQADARSACTAMPGIDSTTPATSRFIVAF
jgi:hypothetical protein